MRNRGSEREGEGGRGVRDREGETEIEIGRGSERGGKRDKKGG